MKDVAARQGISMKYLEQIAGLLGKAGFLRSGRGALGGISSDESAGGVYPGQYPPADRGKSGPGGLPGDGGERLRAVRRLPDPGLLDGPVCGRERICRPLHPGGSGAGGIGETGESVPTLHRLNGKTPASYRGRRLFEKQVSPSARRSRRAVRRASPARGRARGGRPPGFPWPPWESRGRFTMSVPFRMPAAARDSMARFVTCMEA